MFSYCADAARYVPTILLDYLQVNPPPQTKHNHQQRLYAMYNQRKDSCIGGRYAIQHHHGDNGKMPWSCTIWCWYYHRYATNNECHQSASQTQVACRLKTLECQVVVKEITEPYAEGESYEQRNILHTL